MLEFLKIENLALLKSAQLDFKRGFTVVTGETGAGKSVLLGALSILAGNRAGKEIIGSNSERCSVEAVLNFTETGRIDEILKDCGLPVCEDGALVLRRIIERNKAGKCFVNGSLSTLANLQKIGEFWVDFHGSNEPQKLFSSKNQLMMLDDFAKIGELKAEYLAFYGEILASEKRIAELKGAKKMSADEMEFAKSQIEKIDALRLSEEGIAELENSYKLMENSREVLEKSQAVAEMLGGEDGVCDKLACAIRLSGEISNSCAEASALARRINEVSIEISDISDEFSSLSENCSFTEEDALQIRERMDAWLNVRRKYGSSVREVLKIRDEMAQKIALQGDVKASIKREEENIERLKVLIFPVSEKILKEREKAGALLEKKVVSLLKKTGFKRPDFKVRITASEVAGADCGSVCEFEFSANPGQAPLPLAKIASSGELARVMLAIKTTMADADHTALLVFDEVDANVGGEIGAEVGGELAKLSGEHQVLCVTHLPQVAAFGANHLLVEKFQTSSFTSVKISELNPNSEERVSELARMLGDRNSASALTHARELLTSKIS